MPCFVNKLLLALAIFLPVASLAQLTTGVVEGIVRDPNNHPLGGAEILITGIPGFRAVIHATAEGAFVVALPYGEYRFQAGDGRNGSTATLFVAPLQTERLDLIVTGTAGAPSLKTFRQAARNGPGLWLDHPRDHSYPEPFSLQGVLLSREPSSVTQPLNLIGLSDNRLTLESQRGYSWTDIRFKLNGIDATDSYQPGRPTIQPDLQALDEVVVRSGSGVEAGLFLAEPGTRWHGALSSADTGGWLASTNLPPPADRGLVQQPDQFHWMTRDGLEVSGPVTRWADVFASAAGQWASQNVPLAMPGTSQNSRMLFGNVRSRIRASERDRIDGVYSGSRIDLSNYGTPAGIEDLAARRMAPSFVLPGGFPGQPEIDHLDFAQVGWTRLLGVANGLGTIEARYGYSTAHLDSTQAPYNGPPQSRIELVGGTITGLPPLANLAIRTRHDLETTWLPGEIHAGAARFGIVLGAGWKNSSSRNRFTTPSDLNLITANGAPAFAVEFNTPLNTLERVRSFSAFGAGHISVTRGLSLDVGVLGDFSRGSLPVQSSPAGSFAPARSFAAQSNLIAWNSVSPRLGLAWRVPHAGGLVLRGGYFREYEPLAGRYLDYGNPNSLGGSEYQLIDRNGDGWFQPGELGALLLRFGGPYSSISPSLGRPYADEFNVVAEFPLGSRSILAIDLFRRDTRDRIAAIDTGVPATAFTPRTILDPGPDGIPGTFDDQQLTVYQQNAATFGADRYLLTNPPGLRMLNTGLIAEARTQWRGLTLNASFVAEKSYGPTNPGDAVYENDPGVTGALFLDPNTAIHAAGRSFTDRAYVGKIQATRKAWAGIDLASVATYTDGLVFARQLLVTSLAQGPFLVATTVRGSPGGGNRAEYVLNWNLRIQRNFNFPIGHFSVTADILNVPNFGQRIQENDQSGPAFNLRLPVAIQAPRFARFEFRYAF